MGVGRNLGLDHLLLIFLGTREDKIGYIPFFFSKTTLIRRQNMSPTSARTILQ